MAIKVNFIKVQEGDFLNARLNLIPTVHRSGSCKQRSLSKFIAPLLDKELRKVIRHINMLLPHFLQPERK